MTTQTTEITVHNEGEAQLANVIEHATRDHLRNDPAAIHAMKAALVHEVRRVPKLFECSPDSMAAAAVTCAELGLYPKGSIAHIHLIPRGGQVTVQIGYRGLMELARRAGVHVDTDGVVYRQEVERGLFTAELAPFSLSHRFSLEDIGRSDGELVAAYASCVVDGARVGVILTRADLDKRRNRAMGGGNKGPWSTDYAAMCRKSAIRALLQSGKVPLSAEVLAGLGKTDEARQAVQAPEAPRIEVQPEPADPTARAAAALDDGGTW